MAANSCQANPTIEVNVVGTAAHSRFVQRIRRRYAGLMTLLPAGAPVRACMEAALPPLRAQGLDLASALRVLRQLVIERLAVLDCDGKPEQQAPLAVVTRAMTELAELALDLALAESAAALDALHGAPLIRSAQVDASGSTGRALLWVVGMGKLGARELNVSSDIDLIYVYDHSGETAGREGGRGIGLALSGEG